MSTKLTLLYPETGPSRDYCLLRRGGRHIRVQVRVQGKGRPYFGRVRADDSLTPTLRREMGCGTTSTIRPKYLFFVSERFGRYNEYNLQMTRNHFSCSPCYSVSHLGDLMFIPLSEIIPDNFSSMFKTHSRLATLIIQFASLPFAT